MWKLCFLWKFLLKKYMNHLSDCECFMRSIQNINKMTSDLRYLCYIPITIKPLYSKYIVYIVSYEDMLQMAWRVWMPLSKVKDHWWLFHYLQVSLSQHFIHMQTCLQTEIYCILSKCTLWLVNVFTHQLSNCVVWYLFSIYIYLNVKNILLYWIFWTMTKRVAYFQETTVDKTV